MGSRGGVDLGVVCPVLEEECIIARSAVVPCVQQVFVQGVRHGHQNGALQREREIYFKVPTSLRGDDPANIGCLEGASPVCLLFLASVRFLCLASPREKSPGPHMEDQESNPRPRTQIW